MRNAGGDITGNTAEGPKIPTGPELRGAEKKNNTTGGKNEIPDLVPGIFLVRTIFIFLCAMSRVAPGQQK